MKELSKKLLCLCMRNGVEIWVEEDRLTSFKNELRGLRSHKFIELPDGQWGNTADLIGIFNAQSMEDAIRRKNGEWQCRWQKWHAKGERCECEPANFPVR